MARWNPCLLRVPEGQEIPFHLVAPNVWVESLSPRRPDGFWSPCLLGVPDWSVSPRAPDVLEHLMGG